MRAKLFALVLFSILLLGLNSFFVSADCEAGQVDINTANKDELDTLYGIGSSKAESIIEYRDSNNPFEKLEDLLNVSGIGEKTLENMQEEREGYSLPCVEGFENQDNSENTNNESQETEESGNESSDLEASSKDEESDDDLGNFEESVDDSNGEDKKDSDFEELSYEVNEEKQETTNEQITQPKTIVLNPKDIKSKNNVEFGKKQYLTFGLITFSMFLVLLFLLKKYGDLRDKNEFG